MATFKTILADTTTQLTQGGVIYGAANELIDSTASGAVGFKNKSTYALMIADGTPAITTIYSITNDENKSYTRSTYIWKNDGNREWIASTPDN